MYLTYLEFTDMGGTLDETTFNDLEFEAECIIDWYTFSRLRKETTFSDNVKKLMYRLIQIIQMRQQALSLGQDAGGNGGVFSGAIASQSNDGFSTSFNVLSAEKALQVSDDEIKNLVKRYLQAEMNSLGHRLLYRGIYPDE